MKIWGRVFLQQKQQMQRFGGMEEPALCKEMATSDGGGRLEGQGVGGDGVPGPSEINYKIF